GVLIAQKGVAVDEEVRASARAREVLSGSLREIVSVQLPDLEPRHLVIIEKVAATPDTYPRRAGVPERRPLVR
ncbi:MAG: 16S rRNA (guanine(527)-N(7))-methyltransferase RsmG, partial [Anaerolineae bacterium]|nr:16S rRNA (guanine(527)-N(7))-methyltransferase RsmG [Anaerolineae bacterium]